MLIILLFNGLGLLPLIMDFLHHRYGNFGPYEMVTRGRYTSFFSDEHLPSFLTVFLQFIFCRIALSTSFYWTHRILHMPWFYQRVHKQHHEYSGTIAFAAEYAHWFEQLFSNQIPTVLPVVLCGAHVTVFWLWLAWRLWETYEAHSGFAFPSFVLHGEQAHYHDYHHTRNDGNYSGDILWDALMGTTGTWVERQRELAKVNTKRN